MNYKIEKNIPVSAHGHNGSGRLTNIIKEIFSNKMVPLSIKGIEEATKILSKK